MSTSTCQFKRVHIVTNPAAGNDEPMLNIVNDVFASHGVEWSVSVTLRAGDAEAQAREAVAAGADLVACYGGDGTVHEVVNGLVGTGVPLGLLPGGTWNGFASEAGIPRRLADAAALLCSGGTVGSVDVGRAHGRRYVGRLWVGMEPDQDADRALKNRLGIFAYGAALAKNLELLQPTTYRLTVDDVPLHVQCRALFVVNSSLADMGLPIGPEYALDDGLLHLFLLSSGARDLLAAGATALRLPVANSPWATLSCRRVMIELDQPDDSTPLLERPIWADGEAIGRTPVMVEVEPGALRMLRPAPAPGSSTGGPEIPSPDQMGQS